MAKAKRKRGGGSTRPDLEARAQDILENGIILDLGSNRFRVSSQSQKNRFYDVGFLDVCKCSFPYNIHGHGYCKHAIAVSCNTHRADYNRREF